MGKEESSPGSGNGESNTMALRWPSQSTSSQLAHLTVHPGSDTDNYCILYILCEVSDETVIQLVTQKDMLSKIFWNTLHLPNKT